MKLSKILPFVCAVSLSYCTATLADSTDLLAVNPPASDSKNHVITPEELFRPLQVDHPWSVMVYGGITANEDLGPVITLNFTASGESIYSVELAYVFYRNLFSEFQIAGNGAVRLAEDQNPVPEVDLYVMYRIIKFPWDNYITTTVAAGEGISYAFSAPYSEEKNNTHTEDFLDFLTFELTLGLPKYPDWQLVARIHHRSGMYGTFCPRSYNAGSNALGLGIRYSF
jgi:hypothetical protein